MLHIHNPDVAKRKKIVNSNYQGNTCWILSYPRTGSTLLSRTLNSTKIFNPIFKEWLNPRNRDYQDHRAVFWKPWKELDEGATKETLITRMPNFLKLHRWQFRLFFDDQNKPIIDAAFPKMKYILLKRRDLIATAVSYYLTRNTQVFCVHSEEAEKEFQNKAVPINQKLLLEMHVMMDHYYTSWEKYLTGSDYLPLFYEDIVKDPLKTARDVLDYLEIKHDKSLRLPTMSSRKMIHPQTENLKALLKNMVGEDFRD